MYLCVRVRVRRASYKTIHNRYQSQARPFPAKVKRRRRLFGVTLRPQARQGRAAAEAAAEAEEAALSWRKEEQDTRGREKGEEQVEVRVKGKGKARGGRWWGKGQEKPLGEGRWERLGRGQKGTKGKKERKGVILI